MKRLISICLLLYSFTVAASEMPKIVSDRTFEVVKFKKYTDVYMIDSQSTKKKKIFSKIIRDDVQWIHAPKGSKKIIIATRPMIAGAEPSNFWVIENGKTRHLGATRCADHEIKSISLKQIDYLCLSIDPKNPLEYLEERVRLKVK